MEPTLPSCSLISRAPLNLDPSRLALTGDSIGGNMAAAVILLAKERDGPNIIFQVLFYPVIDANFDTPSYQQFATGHLARKQPTVSSLRASIEQLKMQPPVLVITGEFDVLRDEGEAYAHKLNEAGVRVTAARYLGTIHDFVVLNPITETPAPRAAISQANDMLRKAFSR